jgi:hypothetical protein
MPRALTDLSFAPHGVFRFRGRFRFVMRPQRLTDV